MGLFKRKQEQTEVRSEAEDVLLRNALSGTAVKMTEKTALEIPGFAAAVDFVASTVAMLPIKLYEEIAAEQETVEIVDDVRLSLLNDETNDTLNPYELKKAVVRDMLLSGNGYAYIERNGIQVKSIRYVEQNYIMAQKGVDPIFKTVDVMVNGKHYNPWDFIILTRNTIDGITGQGLIDEHNILLSASYNMLRLENNMSTSGGGKKGFLQSENKLTQAEVDALKEAWNKMYSSPDNRAIVLNNGIKFQEGSNSAVDLQLNQNKLTNTNQLAMLLGLSPDVISGKASNDVYMSSIKTAVLPVVQALQMAINRALLLESEKQSMYFVIDTAELLRSDIKTRYEAYKIGLDANFLQPDEIRYKEDLPPLGLDFIKLGLKDVLYNPKTKQIYTPNTNNNTELGENGEEVTE